MMDAILGILDGLVALASRLTGPEGDMVGNVLLGAILSTAGAWAVAWGLTYGAARFAAHARRSWRTATAGLWEAVAHA